jgi:alpha-mannosidase
LFNPLNWTRNDPLRLRLPPGARLAGIPAQADADGSVLCQPELPSLGIVGLELAPAGDLTPKTIRLPPTIETVFYSAEVDPRSGALISLKLKPSGREVLAGPILLVAEKGGDGHNTPPRPQRPRLATASQFKAELTVTTGPLATVVQVDSTFHGGGKTRQTIHFYQNSPRIDFETELNDIPNQTVVVAEFPLAEPITEVRRGIPYGFSHGAWGAPRADLHGFADGIQAAIRWSHYQFARGGGVALLDRGLPGRELNGQTPVLFLLNAQDFYMGYPCAWLSGKGGHRTAYALLAHDGEWKSARIPRAAWEFNAEPILAPGLASTPPTSFVLTSDNVIVEAMRREGRFVELRLAESQGFPGEARLTIALPHQEATLTDLTGARPQALPSGPHYRLQVRPQQILTLRLATAQPVEEIQPLLKWDELAPAHKLEALRKRLPDRKGHPPRGPAP